MQVLWINIGDTIKSGFYGVMMAIDSLIYTFISSSYKIFMNIAGARLLSSDAYTTIANKLYLIIGVCMLFILAYAILQGIIDPDKKSDASGGKMVKSILIAVFGLALAPVLFNILYQAQGLFLEQDVIGKIFFRSDFNDNSKEMFNGGTVSLTVKDQNNQDVTKEESFDGGNANEAIKNTGGAITATSIWSAFFYPINDGEAANIKAGDFDKYRGTASAICLIGGGIGGKIAGTAAASAAAGAAAGTAAAPFTFGISLVVGAAVGLAVGVAASSVCDNLAQDGLTAANIISGSEMTLEDAYYLTSNGQIGFDIYATFLPQVLDDDAEINYSVVISTIVGLIVLYCFVSFSIDMGVRAAKLAYYQIIAPVPIILQIVPKFRDRFNKYIQSIFSTFLEVFIRISVVYVIVYIISHLPDMFSSSNLWHGSLSAPERTTALALLIVGLVIFAKQAPKLISETFGIQSGSLNLGIGKKLAEGGVFAAGGVLGAMATSGIREYRKGLSKPGSASQRIGRGLVRGLRGAGSAGARSIGSQFIGPNHKQAMTWSDMKAQAGQSAQAATDAGDRRDKFYQEQASKGRTGISAFAAGHVENAVDRFNAWSTGTVDTSYMDGQVSFYSNLKGLEGKLEDAVKNDAIVKDAQRKADMLNNVDIADLAYTQALNTKAITNVEAAKAAALKGMTDVDKRARWIREGMNPTAFSAAAFDAEVDSGRIKDAYTQAEIDSEKDSLRTGTFKRSDYTVDVTSSEYKEAQNILSKQMKDAATELSNAKKEAVQRKLAEAATGIENDASRTIKEFFNENQKDIRAYANEELFKDATGRSVSVSEYVSKNFGAGAIVNGTVDLGQILGSQNNVISYKLEGTGGSDIGNVIVTNTATGQASFEVQELDSSGAITNTLTFSTQKEYQDYIASHNVAKIKDSTLTGERKAVTADLKTKAESARDVLTNSEEYRNAKARQRAAQEKK